MATPKALAGGFKIIKLTKNKTVVVDGEDFDFLNQWKWHAGKNGSYAARGEWQKGKNKNKIIYMHRLIMKVEGKTQVDHKNGNGLDNRKENLRLCTNKENQRNHKLLVTNKSGFNGVSWNSKVKKWETCISVDNKTVHLGFYRNKIKSATIYNAAATKYFGEFARLNNIGGTL